MRLFFLFMTVLGLVVSLGSVLVAQDTAADEEAIRQLGLRWEEAWANRDAQALAALYTDDADGISAMGETVSGRMAIEENFTKRFEDLPESAQNESEVIALRFIRPTIAIVDGAWAVSGLPEGVPAAGLWTAVVVKKDGEWLYTAARSRIPMVPPSGEE
jgi:uncharacterized protein (TIGR02246 family)